MRLLLLMTIVLLCACATDSESSMSAKEHWTWERWREALLSGTPTSELPPIPTDGWRRDEGRSWSRFGAQLADYDADGRLDYIRIADPPGSYNHRIWLDHDRDGHLDYRNHRPAVEGADGRFPVPLFEPANGLGPVQADSLER